MNYLFDNLPTFQLIALRNINYKCLVGKPEKGGSAEIGGGMRALLPSYRVSPLNAVDNRGPCFIPSFSVHCIGHKIATVYYDKQSSFPCPTLWIVRGTMSSVRIRYSQLFCDLSGITSKKLKMLSLCT
jgi:hypothetical protein